MIYTQLVPVDGSRHIRLMDVLYIKLFSWKDATKTVNTTWELQVWTHLKNQAQIREDGGISHPYTHPNYSNEWSISRLFIDIVLNLEHAVKYF